MRKVTYLLFIVLLAVASHAAITYVDANFTAGTGNTVLAAGGAAVPTNGNDAADGIWRYRTGFGIVTSATTLPTGVVPTGGTVYEGTGNSNPSDDVPRVVTTASVAPGVYDVYVYFWIDQNGSPWRIRAGLQNTVEPLTGFIGSNTLTPTDTPVSFVAFDTNNRRLMQAYVGQTSGSSISVYVEDYPATSGIERTWYDGIGYQKAYNKPYAPSVTPANANGTVGTLVNGDTQAEVTLHFNAGADPNSPVNPEIEGHYIYLSPANDPNLYLVDYVQQVHNPDPMLTDPANSYGPLTLDINATYNWQVEEAISDPNGGVYPAGSPNNYAGEVWSFGTIGPQCTISSVAPELSAVTAGSTAVLSITGTNIADYQWYKIGSPDIQLANGSKYAGVTTATLTITDVQLADEGYYYCTVSNPVSTASNRDTGAGRVMIKRLVNHYPMEVINGNTTPDVVGGADMTLYTNGTVMPALVSGVVGSSGLSLDTVAEPAGQFGQIPAGVLDYADFTLTAWVYWKGGLGFQRLFAFGNDTTHYASFTPNSFGSSATFTIMDATDQGVQTYSQLLPMNQWVHVAVSINGNTGRLYVNGAMAARNTGMTHDPINFKPALNYIGKSQDAAEPYLNGMIDDLKIYNAALTNTEVAQEYTAVQGGYVCDAEGADSMTYDFNRDCRVDLADFTRIATDWLNDNRIY